MLTNAKWISKSWGGEKWIVNNDLYCGKILYVMRGKYCSFHYHEKKLEHFMVLSGQVDLIHGKLLPYEDRYSHDFNLAVVKRLNVGDIFEVPIGMPHRFVALEDSQILEISTHHEDSDSIRLLPSCEADHA